MRRTLTAECLEAFRRIDLHWHDLRYEYASRLVERGVPPAQVRDFSATPRSSPPSDASDAALRNAVLLAKAAKTLGMPIVMMASMEDHVQGPLAPALQQVARDAYAARIKRLGIVNAWADPDFKAAVVATGRRQLVMAGVTTDICLVFPTISAVNDGYEVQAVLDASGSSFELQEDMARHRMENAGVVLTATNTIIAELALNWATPVI
jgi:nicotinamidase-related amidase